MRVLAVHNIKGGVGKTTSAVNLAHRAAAEGLRTLLWDLDPQGAATWILRVRPRVAGRVDALLGEPGPERSIRGSDYPDLDLLPADFSYRRMDRLLGAEGRRASVERDALAGVLARVEADYDVAVLDCAPGLSTVAERVFDVAGALLIPTIPTPLALRTLAQLMKHLRTRDAERRPSVLPFFTLVDARKRIHADTLRYARENQLGFLEAAVPYASLVEQMSSRREPLAVYAGRSKPALAYAAVWDEVERRLGRGEAGSILARPGARGELKRLARGLGSDLRPGLRAGQGRNGRPERSSGG